MANIKVNYPAAVGVTAFYNSLGSATYSSNSGTIDNTANLYLDYFVECQVVTGTVVAPSLVYVYAVGSVDGTNFSDASAPGNLRLLGYISCPSNATTYRGPAMSVASAFGGTCPQKFQLVVYNSTGASLATSASNSCQTAGLYNTAV